MGKVQDAFRKVNRELKRRGLEVADMPDDVAEAHFKLLQAAQVEWTVERYEYDDKGKLRKKKGDADG